MTEIFAQPLHCLLYSLTKKNAKAVVAV